MLANSQHILIVHTKKEANCVAHRLSRLAFTTSERYWVEDVTYHISFDVQHDIQTILDPVSPTTRKYTFNIAKITLIL